jgi:hypothetical protein
MTDGNDPLTPLTGIEVGKPPPLADVQARHRRHTRSRRALFASIAAGAIAVGALVWVAPRNDTVDTITGPAPTTTSSTPAAAEDEIPSSGDLPFGLVRCPDEKVRVAAPDEYYRDEPVYVGNNPPTEDIKNWARTKPGFEGLWRDRTHNGWITLAFSQDADLRQTELEEEFPGLGLVAVAVDWTDSELELLREQALGAMRSAGLDAGGGHSVSEGLVSVFVGVLDEAHLAPLASFADERLCVEGVDAADAVVDGPQPTEGDGWRLLGTQRTGFTYRTGVATTTDQYEALWGLSGISAEAPAVDFGTEIVVWFGAVYGSSCEIRLDDVIIDTEGQLVFGDFVIPGNPGRCESDANPEAYVVAIERTLLPAAPFDVQLGERDPPKGVPEERTVVKVDLRGPGSTATDDDLSLDPELFADASRGYVIGAGGVMEIGFPALYDLDLSCDFELIGPVNGVVWRAENVEVSKITPPAAWVSVATAAGLVEIELLLSEDPPTLTLSAGDHTERFLPAPNGTESNCP